MVARILVVDDIEANVRVLEAKLTAEYYDVISAMDGTTALAMAAADGPDIILLDNMTPAQVSRAVAAIGGAAVVEVSGGVTLATLRDYALPGVDVISIGALTHSAPAADLSLTLPARQRR